jgi:hypothetical protein
VEGWVKLVVVAADVGRKCDASFCNLDFALVMVEKNYEIRDTDVKNNQKKSKSTEGECIKSKRQFGCQNLATTRP